MAEIDLKNVDLNLLVVLDVLLREQSVGLAADRLNLTQSAVSHALKRLRALFDDELLVRDGRSMVPTTHARTLAEQLPSMLAHIERVLRNPSPFDPATSDRVFRLVAPDFFTSSTLRLLEHTSRAAPNVRVEMTPFTPAWITEMKAGRCDALIAPRGLKADELRRQDIGSWPWVVFGREGHPAFADWSIEAWARYPHIQVRTAAPEGKGPIAKMAERLGIQRRIGAVVPHFSVAASALSRTDMLLTVPTVALGDSPESYNLEHRPVPFDIAPLELSLYRSATTGAEPDVRWFLERVSEVCSNLMSC